MARIHALVVAGVAMAAAFGQAHAGQDDLPIYPVDRNCREAMAVFFKTSRIAPERKAGLERDCIRRQQAAYDDVKRVWPALQAKDRRVCLHVTTTTNYLHLRECVATLYAQEVLATRTDNGTFRR